MWPLALGPGAGEQTDGGGDSIPDPLQEPAGSASWFPGVSGRLTGAEVLCGDHEVGTH